MRDASIDLPALLIIDNTLSVLPIRALIASSANAQLACFLDPGVKPRNAGSTPGSCYRRPSC